MSDKWVDTAREAGKVAAARESSGCVPRLRTITFETAAADTTNDVRRLFTVGAHEIPVQMDVVCDTWTGMSDLDVGLYKPGDDGVVVDADALADGLNPAAGIAWASKLDGLAALGVEERGILPFFEIANDVLTTDVIGHLPNDSYDVCLTYKADASSVGTVTVHLWTIDES
jgi:hypothetical protein